MPTLAERGRGLLADLEPLAEIIAERCPGELDRFISHLETVCSALVRAGALTASEARAELDHLRAAASGAGESPTVKLSELRAQRSIQIADEIEPATLTVGGRSRF